MSCHRNTSNEFQESRISASDDRCGEIFITINRTLSFHCSTCDNIYETFYNFLEHISSEHYTNLKKEILTNEWDNKRNYDGISELYKVEEQVFVADSLQGVDFAKMTPNPDFEEYLEEVEFLVIEKSDNFSVHDNVHDNDGLDVLDDPEVFKMEIQVDNQRTVKPKTKSNAMDSISEHMSTNGEEETSHTKENLKEQPTSKRKSGNDDVYPCELCKKIFVSRQKLKKHSIIHSDERKHKCNICGFAFKDISNLTAHIMRHTDKKNFGCDFCPRKFFTRTESQAHRRVHTGERLYVCSYCGISFITYGGLKCHSRRHTEDPPFKCTYCEKSFWSNNDLEDHLLVHTKEKPFSCPICLAKFPRRKSMLRHTKLHEKSL